MRACILAALLVIVCYTLYRQGKTFKLKHRVRVSEMWVSESVEEVTDVSIPLETSFVFGWPTYNHIAVFR